MFPVIEHSVRPSEIKKKPALLSGKVWLFVTDLIIKRSGLVFRSEEEVRRTDPSSETAGRDGSDGNGVQRVQVRRSWFRSEFVL